MKLTSLVLKKIKEVLDSANINCFLYIAPHTTVYPFVTYYPVSVVTEYTFKEIIEDVNISITYFNNNNTLDIITTMETIEGLFENYSVVDGNYKIICTHKTNLVGPIYNSKENYWQAAMDFNFKAQRNQGT